MTSDDVLYAYRLRVLASARELDSVAVACRLHGWSPPMLSTALSDGVSVCRSS